MKSLVDGRKIKTGDKIIVNGKPATVVSVTDYTASIGFQYDTENGTFYVSPADEIGANYDDLGECWARAK